MKMTGPVNQSEISQIHLPPPLLLKWLKWAVHLALRYNIDLKALKVQIHNAWYRVLRDERMPLEEAVRKTGQGFDHVAKNMYNEAQTPLGLMQKVDQAVQLNTVGRKDAKGCQMSLSVEDLLELPEIKQAFGLELSNPNGDNPEGKFAKRIAMAKKELREILTQLSQNKNSKVEMVESNRYCAKSSGSVFLEDQDQQNANIKFAEKTETFAIVVKTASDSGLPDPVDELDPQKYRVPTYGNHKVMFVEYHPDVSEGGEGDYFQIMHDVIHTLNMIVAEGEISEEHQSTLLGSADRIIKLYPHKKNAKHASKVSFLVAAKYEKVTIKELNNETLH